MAEVTKHGRWVYRDADIHRCGKPTPGDSRNVKSGDIWECNECKTRWRVTVESDMRNGVWFTWKDATEVESRQLPALPVGETFNKSRDYIPDTR